MVEPAEVSPGTPGGPVVEMTPGEMAEDRLAEPGLDQTAEGEESFFATAPEEAAADDPPEEAFDNAPSENSQVERRDSRPPVQARDPRPSYAPLPPPLQPAAPATIRQAIEDAEAVLTSLRDAVETLDELLELVEEAERQKTADEREIEALRQTLRRFQGPMDQIPRRVEPPREQREHREPREHRDAPAAAASQDSFRGQPRYNEDPNRRRRRRGGRGRPAGNPGRNTGQAPPAGGSHGSPGVNPS
jgi:hypothetical protein